MGNELEQTLKQYFSGSRNLIQYYPDSEKSILRFVKDFESFPLVIGDAPDAFIKSDNHLYIIEHFEFDSYAVRSKKGSTYKRELSRINRKDFWNHPSVKPQFDHDSIDGNSSYRIG